MKRTTEGDLRRKIHSLNVLLQRPTNCATNDVPPKFSIGHFALDVNDSGVSLEEQATDSGGVKVIIGPMSKKELFIYISGMIDGINLSSINKGLK
jgi:hypothetical protein